MAAADNGPPTNTQTKSIDNLVATEKMADSDEASTPSLWTEHNFFDEANPLMLSPARPRWLEEIEKPDIEMIKELGSLTKSQLLEKIKELQGIAYQLGLEEAREMARGRCLGIFEDIAAITNNSASPHDPRKDHHSNNDITTNNST